MATRPHFQRLVERVRLLPPLPAAFVFPCDRDSIQLALSGAFAGYLAPVLVGPEMRIRDLADRSGLDISRLPIVDTADAPNAATERAIMLVRDGKVAALVKGSIERRRPARAGGRRRVRDCAPSGGSRTPISSTSPRGRNGMLLADARAQRRAESRRQEGHRRQHDRSRAAARRSTSPAVALIAAMDERSVAFASTADAAALKSMADAGRIRRRARRRSADRRTARSPSRPRAPTASQSEIAGDARRPDRAHDGGCVDASLRTLTGLTRGLAAGIVMGAKVPIVTPGSESMEIADGISCVHRSPSTPPPLARNNRRPSHGSGYRAARRRLTCPRARDRPTAPRLPQPPAYAAIGPAPIRQRATQSMK